jgi:hydrocephalus-inducing protein
MAFEWSFRSSILGEFSETFKWKLEGSTDMLSVIFTGHVMAPKFQFSPSQIDFGKASFSFPKPKTIKL